MEEGNGFGKVRKWTSLAIDVSKLISILGVVIVSIFYVGQWFERTRSEIEKTRESVDKVTTAVHDGFKIAGTERRRIEETVASEVESLRKVIVPRDEWEDRINRLVPKEEWERQWKAHEKHSHQPAP